MSSQFEKRNAKKKTATETNDSQTKETQPEVAMDSLAYDVFLDEETRQHVLVTIKYDLVSGQGEVVDRSNITDSRAVAIQKMKELVTRKLFGLPMA